MEYALYRRSGRPCCHCKSPDQEILEEKNAFDKMIVDSLVTVIIVIRLSCQHCHMRLKFKGRINTICYYNISSSLLIVILYFHHY